MVSFLSRLTGHTTAGTQTSNVPAAPEVNNTVVTNEKRNSLFVDDGSDSAGERRFSQAAEDGVQRIEATTMVWDKKLLIAAYAMIWLIYFVISIQEVIVSSLTPYVTSAFARHGLTAMIDVVATIVAGLLKLPLAKILDTWGRAQGITLMLVFWIMGLIMMAACQNVQTYAAAQVFNSVGNQGVSYCLTVFIADTSSLKNRALMFAFATSPYVVTTWIGGPATESILSEGGIGFRWGFGIFTVIVPVVVLPLSGLFLWAQLKAVKSRVEPKPRAPFSLATVKKYLIDVDAFGILILALGLALFLLPFSLYSYQGRSWESPLIISLITVGGSLVIAFIFYEAYLAPVTFIPFELLLDRSVFFGGLMFSFVFASSGLWGGYIFSHLLVVNDQTITTATYISSIYRVASCGWALFVGAAIRASGRYKWVALYFAVPLQVLAVGLDIKFREPDQSVGFIIMTQIFLACAGGAIVICGELAMLAPVKQENFATIIAILNVFSAVGSAIGSTIATAIWTGVVPGRLARYLPADADAASIYSSIVNQLAYPPGTEYRTAIKMAYYDAEKWQLVASVCLLGVGWACVAVWRNINVKEVKQHTGTVV